MTETGPDPTSPKPATSSRLSRHVSADLALRVSDMCTSASVYCERAFEVSRFFKLLDSGGVTSALLGYVFAQYGFFRIQLHRWFCLCIMKASNAAEVLQRDAIMALADHIFTDLRDDHDVLFSHMLEQLGVGPDRPQDDAPSQATRTYIKSFAEEFGGPERDLREALGGLSGRELSVALRNRRLLSGYFERLQLPRPLWLTLHAELEVDHCFDVLRPVATWIGEDSAVHAKVRAAIECSIQRHVQYLDDLLQEFQAREVADGN